MRPFRALLGGASLLGVLAAPLVGQPRSAYLPPPGTLVVQVGGIDTRFDARFGSTGVGRAGSARTLWGSEFEAAIQQRLRLPSIEELRAPLDGLLQATADTAAPTPGLRVTPDNFRLGGAHVRLQSERATLPLSLGLTVLPRISVGAALPLYRGSRTRIAGLGLDGGTLGLNPDTVWNRVRFARAGAEYAALGAGRLLPTRGSVLGRELQARFRRRFGAADTLRLPAATLGAGVEGLDSLGLAAAAFGPDSLDAGAPTWWLGDLELFARAQLLNTAGPAAYPTGPGLALRSTVSGALRLPTGDAGGAGNLFSTPRDAGHGGFSARLDNDLFLGRHFWASVVAEYRAVAAAELARWVVSPAAPFDSAAAVRIVDYDPGDELVIELAPRLRFGEALSLGGRFAYLSRGEGVFNDVGAAGEIPASVLNTAARTAQVAGVELRYSTLPAAAERQRVLPLEVSFEYLATLAGSGGAPAARIAQIGVSVFPRLWGRR